MPRALPQRKGPTVASGLAKQEDGQSSAMDRSKEKPAKSLTGINGHMWIVIWIRTAKGLSLRGSVHGRSTSSCWFHSAHSKGTPMAGGGQDH